MIQFLTYHKVSASGKSDPDFYTVTGEQLASQIKKLRDAEFAPATADSLKTRSPGEKTFFLSFDDGTLDHFEVVAPILDRFNIRGIFFVPTAKLNRPGYLSDDQVKQLSTAGHVIGCHSHEHKRLDTMTEQEIRHQLRTSTDRLQQLTGTTVWAFAPPGGFINETIRAAALGTGLNVIRTMRWGFNRRPDFASLETIPVNRHTNDRRFQKILEGKQPQLLYLGKQAAKALVPERAYQQLRNLAFKMRRKN